MAETTPVVPADEETRAAVLAVEEQRQRALVEGDLAALDVIFDESLIHVHAPGLTHDKAQLLEHVAMRKAYIDVSRGDLLVRVLGLGADVAVVTGRVINHMRTPDGGERVLAGPATQVLTRGHDRSWRFVSFQMTPDGEPAWPTTAAEQADIDAREKENH